MTQAELNAVDEVFRDGWLGEGAYTERFEREIADFTGAPHVVAVNTGTSALHLALLAVGVEAGDEVIVPSFTFAADPMVVRLCGATPVFADIDPDTLNLDPRHLRSLITPRTKAIMPTDYAGLPADVAAIREAIGGRDIRIVRDAAHSFGSRINGRPVGVWCGEDATAFSFDPIKNLTCGEGGAVLVDDAARAERLRSLRCLGFRHGSYPDPSGRISRDRRIEGEGFRYHLSNVNASIGLAQFRRFGEMAARKQALARLYDRLLAGQASIRTFPRDYDAIVPFIYPVRLFPARPASIVDDFAKQGICVGLRYFPCHQQPLFDTGAMDLPETRRASLELLCLPLYADLTESEVTEVAELLVSYLNAHPPRDSPEPSRPEGTA